VGRVRDLSAPRPDGGELPVRAYEPESDGADGGDGRARDGDRPALVRFHGGGFVLGNLAAAVTLLARDRDGPDIERQVLVYSATNRVRGFESYEENAEGYFLTRADVEWVHCHYLARTVDTRNPYAYPLEARYLGGLPPASVVTAEFDPLRDGGVAYAERLADDGVDLAHPHSPEMIHGSFSMLTEPEVERAWDALGAVAADLPG
jgi:acetyl esterase